MRSKITVSRLGTILAAALLVGMLTIGMTTVAAAGDGVATTAKKKKKKKKKKCPAGTVKKTVKKKHGKKKKKCVPVPVVPPAAPGAPAAVLSISPASFDFGTVEHSDSSSPQPFTVTNIGGSASGVPVVSIQEVHNPSGGVNPPVGFHTGTNTCTAALPAGATCTVNVTFDPPNNAGDELWSSILHVVGSPGGDAQAAINGMAG